MRTLLHVSLFIVRDDSVLLVQEADPEDEQRWNLPGGHVEPGETITAGGIREAREETGLIIDLKALVGVYAGAGTTDKRAIRFVFHADAEAKDAVAGDDVLAVRWFSQTELANLPNERLLGSPVLRAILHDGFAGKYFPLAVLCEQ